ncbi:MAG: Hpt domain-containing protein [Chromatiales bacterium]|nr:Hpt domain-containing protein [Chromatiales bacterium]
MQMAEQFDIGTLAWVKGEIDETLKQAQNALEAFAKDEEDESQLEFCISYVHQVYGTLHMVELQGAAQFAEEIEKFAVALREKRIENRDGGFELLMQAILQLPDYLEGLMAGKKDNASSLIPTLNEMRTKRGEQALSQQDESAADLSINPPAKAAEIPDRVTTRLLAKKVQPYLITALTRVIKGLELETSLKNLGAVIEKILLVASGDECRRLLWVSSAFIEALRDNALELSVENKKLLGKIEQQIRILVARDEAGLVTDAVSELIAVLLHRLASSTASGNRALEVRQAFRLDVTGEAVESALPVSVNAELKKTISADIMEELARAKDVFDIYVRTERSDATGLEPMAENLTRMADTLSLLQEETLQQTLRSQVEIVQQLVRGELTANDDNLMGIAGAILAVESAIGDWGNVTPVERADAADEQVAEADSTPEAIAEHQRVIRQVMKEARDDLIKIRETISAYLEKPGEKSSLKQIPDMLHLVIGSLNVLSYRRVAQIMNSCNHFIAHELISSETLPEASKLDALADAVMSVEYYLEAFVQSRVHPGSVLDVAENAVAQMGYPASDAPLVQTAIDSVGDGTLHEMLAVDSDGDEPEVADEPITTGIANDAARSAAQSAATVEVDDEILEIFIEEAEEELEKIGDLLPRWIADAGDEESLKDLRRCFHTLKGSGRLVGAVEVGEFAWAFENMLNRVLDGTISSSTTMFDMLQQANETLPSLVDRFKGGSASAGDAETLRQMAEEMAQSGEVKSPPPSPPPKSEVPVSHKEESASQSGEEDAAIDLPDLDPVLLEIYSKESEGHLEVLRAYLREISEGGSRKVSEPIIRALHTLKGSSHMAGVNSVSDVSKALEKYCKTLQALNETVNDKGVEALQQCVDYVDAMLTYLLDSSKPYPNNSQAKALAEEVYAEVEHLEHVADAAPEAGLASIDEVEAVALEEITEELLEPEAVQADELIEMALDAASGSPGIELDIEELQGALDEPSSTLTEDEVLIEFDAQEPESLEDVFATPAVAQPAFASFEEEYDPELLDIFLEEGVDILNESEQTLQEWVNNPDDRSLVEALQRQLHTLKGGARMAGITPVGDLSHSLESTFDAVVDGMLERSPEMIDLLQLSHDRLVTMLEQVRNQEPVVSGDDLIARVDALSNPVMSTVEEITVDGDQDNFVDSNSDSVEFDEIELLDAADEIELLEPELVSDDEFDSDIDLEIVEEESSTVATKPLGALYTLFDTLGDALTAWQRDTDDADLFDSLSQAVDSLNVGCHASRIVPLIEIADALQVLISAINDGHVATSEKVSDLLTLASERMHLIANQQRDGVSLENGLFIVSGIRDLIAEGLAREEGITDEIVVDIDEAAKRKAIKNKVAEDADDKRRKAPRIQHEVVRVRADLLDNLANFAGEVSIYRSRVEQQIGTFGSNLGEMDQTIARLRDQLRQVEIETEAQIDSRRAEAQKQGYDDFDPLEFDRFTNMQTLSRSMAESLNDLLSIEEMLRGLSRETETLLLQQSRVNTELQESLMHTRMVPMSEQAPRLRRVVRQTASELGKRASLVLDGVEVEMDRNVVERMLAPLEHMLRNSLAHGIEDKAARKKAGKPEEGTIHVALTREGSEIVIRVSDDGGGINLEAVKKKAIDRGLMQAGAQLSDKEIMHFILESGFSTAAALTQIAGRGVGMDVVNSEIKQLGGVLEIDSEYGKGTLFTVRLPLTLSVSRALLVNVGDDIYAIPILSISGIERIAGAELESLLETEAPTFNWVNEDYHVMHLTSVLGAGSGAIHLGTKQPLLLSTSGGHRVAFAVDGLIGSREIVVKSLGPQLSSLQDLAGATILADGSVALIIDMPALVRRGLAKLGTESVTRTEALPVVDREPVVMVVDDSITVRKVTERLLKRNNMKCVTAKDGVDAITVLDEVIPDVMLLDIEMPRMDGFELATHIRNSERLKGIPIIMITSRTGDKHRQRAMDIGVNEYMGKPYTEADLLTNIEKQLELAK